MILYRLIFHILFIPIVIGVNETKVESTDNIKSSVAPKNLLQKEVKENNKTKNVTLTIEGGSITVPQTNLTLINENDALVLPKLPTEELPESSSKNKSKHVVGRTGVPVIEFKDISTKPPIAVNKSTIIKKLTSTVKTTLNKTVESTIKPHKPLVLKYQEGSSIVAEKISTISSDGTTQGNKPGSHPGMIMPIVITVLVVPLFAVLGYMALKRGKEAWKNRHYKRMDFLLDGMYND